MSELPGYRRVTWTKIEVTTYSAELFLFSEARSDIEKMLGEVDYEDYEAVTKTMVSRHVHSCEESL